MSEPNLAPDGTRLPSCDSGPGGRLGFVLRELREILSALIGRARAR